ncbi:MAG: ADP-glyceromanno-heptose 6-epimerase [Oxalobacter sp.]|nr:ADP-glyceromanno-heptose 6-epimerase [Oxalobacter sp.]
MYIVTGGAGFIGSAMVWKLNQMGIDDILIVDNLASTEKWKNLVNRRFTEYLHRDVFQKMMDEDRLPDQIEGIIHLGACSSTTERNVDFLMGNNVNYSKTLCRLAMAKGIRFINASSAATYGAGEQGFSDSIETALRLKPLNAYGWSKQLFDLWAIRENRINSIASVKFFNVYGPNEYHKGDMRSVICKVFADIRNGLPIRLFKSDHPDYGDGESLRDFVYVKDCVNVLWWLLEHPDVNGILNIGSGKARSWNDLAKAVYAAMELPVNIEYFEMPASLKGKYQYFTEAVMDWKAKAGCDVQFHSLEEGVADYVRNYMMQDDPHLEQIA